MNSGIAWTDLTGLETVHTFLTFFPIRNRLLSKQRSDKMFLMFIGPCIILIVE